MNKDLIAVIGSAGRGKENHLTRDLWQAMVSDIKERISPCKHLISGGAAWADHLAVIAYLNNWCEKLTLYLPASLTNNGFNQVGRSYKSAASISNYYHKLFSNAAGIDSIAQLVQARDKGATIFAQPDGLGASALFTRNKLVAQNATSVIAYTFGEGDEPGSSGTAHTWRLIKSENKVHISMMKLARGLSQESTDKKDAKNTQIKKTPAVFSFKPR